MANIPKQIDYKRLARRKYVLLLAGALACLVSVIIDVLVGPSNLTITETVSSIFGLPTADPLNITIVWTLRLPTAMMAIAVGAALGIAGAGMQTILNNPLASPYTLGVSASAGFGAALAIVVGMSVFPMFSQYMVPISAFVFAVLSCLLIYFIGKFRSLTPETMVLAGIGLLFLFQALLAFLQYRASPEVLQTIVFWLFGSLNKSTWPKVAFVGTMFLVIFIILMRDCWKLTALKLGDEKAEGLGVHVERLRLKVFILISLLTAGAVSFVGTIGFIGLVGPHIARMLVGEDQRFFLPMSAIGGALLLSVASIGTKTLVPGAIFPIGIITALVGVPFFFSLILTNKKGYW